MRQAYKIIPVYTSDVSGVCSALYELGGMVVMHDPSGCNSTYNTHDEIRWYDMDSMIYISGLTEIDAIMGNDAKFIKDIENMTLKLHPKFIALVGSPIPFINGTDFNAIARILEKDTGIPAFFVKTNGTHDYVMGAGEALRKIAERFVTEKNSIRAGSINILGATPLDFGPMNNIDIMKSELEKLGWSIISTWAMGDSLEDILNSASAEVNLVVSSVGLPTAKYLNEKYGTPYVVGIPVSGYLKQINDALRSKTTIPYLDKRQRGNADIAIIGEPVTMESLAAAIEEEYKTPVRVVCPLETYDELLGDNDIKTCGEEEIEEVLKDYKIIIADPLYRSICPSECTFYELPHVAFSGRIYLKEMAANNLFTKKEFGAMMSKKNNGRYPQ